MLKEMVRLKEPAMLNLISQIKPRMNHNQPLLFPPSLYFLMKRYFLKDSLDGFPRIWTRWM
jgi:hypothetical protein